MGLYSLPQEFQERFQDRFQGRFRIRWSDKWNQWELEQKVRRGLAGTPLDQDRYNDDVIRYRDGFMWVMSIKQGTRFDCPKCGLTLKAPFKETRLINCEHCHAKGYEYRWLACHWPMDDSLIEHVERLEKGIDELKDKLYSSERSLRRQQERMVLDPLMDGFRDRFEQGMNIQSVGYTGKIFTGGS